MNKRQFKKANYKRFVSGGYNATRKRIQRQHFEDINEAREYGCTIWSQWKGGYPNRFRLKQWLNAPMNYYYED